MKIDLETALGLPFDEYMNWCHQFCNAKASNPVFAMVVESRTFLEAVWAKRYWFNKCGVDYDQCEG